MLAQCCRAALRGEMVVTRLTNVLADPALRLPAVERKGPKPSNAFEASLDSERLSLQPACSSESPVKRADIERVAVDAHR